MAVEFKDYYKTLGVEKGASEDEIRKAFRRLARQYHPDVAKDKAGAEERFKEINEAYEVLGDREKRKRYDQLGARWQGPDGVRPPPGWEGMFGGAGAAGPGAGGFDFEFGGTGFSDFFEMFFGSRGRRARGRAGTPFGEEGEGGFWSWGGEQPHEAMRGQDTEVDLMVTLGEALHGATRKITLRRHGERETQTYDVRIPARVHEGQRIRLAGQGERGHAGGPRGDLYLRVKLALHPDYRVEGNDLYRDVSVPAWVAVLGGSVSIETLDGQVRLRIPAGTQGGQRFRLRGHGLPVAGHGRGDLYAVAEIDVPREIDARQRRLWEELAESERGEG